MHKLLLLSIFAGVLSAAPVFDIVPYGGNDLVIAPGDIGGWGFYLAPDPSRDITIISTFVLNETNPVGFYVDFLAAKGGPTFGALLSSDLFWEQGFDFGDEDGLGYYAVYAQSMAGARTDGTLRVVYEYLDEGFSCDECFFDVPFSVTVAEGASPNPVPEPSTLAMISVATVALAAVRRRR